MAEVLNAQSVGITARELSTRPIIGPSFGRGVAAEAVVFTDVLAVSATLFSGVGNYARVLRVPSRMRVQSLVIATDVAPDASATQDLAFDIGVAFSDDPNDGTPQALLGLIPTTVGTGGDGGTAGTTTTFSAYTTPNKLYGTITLAGNNAKIPPTEVVLNGITATYDVEKVVHSPLAAIFNFLDVRTNQVRADLGWLDIYLRCNVVAETPQACKFFARAIGCF